MPSISSSYRCNYNSKLDFDLLASLCFDVSKNSSQAEREISLSFVEAAEIQDLNNKYRDKNYSTDVLSFPAEDPHTLGDIVICIEKAESQARELGHSLDREIAFLFVHGLLHLLGYDHEISQEDERIMFDLQDRILAAAQYQR